MSFEGLPSGLEGFRQCFTANGRLVIEHINFCEPSSQGVNIQVAKSRLGRGLVSTSFAGEFKLLLVIMMVPSGSLSEETDGELKGT